MEKLFLIIRIFWEFSGNFQVPDSLSKVISTCSIIGSEIALLTEITPTIIVTVSTIVTFHLNSLDGMRFETLEESCRRLFSK